jgi:hypothetical protein
MGIFLGGSDNRLGVSLRMNRRGGNGNALEQGIVIFLRSFISKGEQWNEGQAEVHAVRLFREG